MVSTDWTASSTVSTSYASSTALESATRLDSSTVLLNSATVTLLGYSAGANLLNDTVSTDYTPASVVSTNWS